MHNTKIDIAQENRQKLVEFLNARLADSLDLQSQSKQAHWNVKGMSFIALHELFDNVHTEVMNYSDMIAERVTTLGGIAEGTVRTAAEKSTLAQYPAEITDGADHVAALSSALADFTRKIRADIDESDRLSDAVTADLLTEIARGTDKLLWFVEAHAQS